MMASAVPNSVPTAIAPSTQNTVPILIEPQLGPYQPFMDKSIVPNVPRDGNPDETTPQPGFGGSASIGATFLGGNPGAPSVPVDGYLWIPGPIDDHYVSEAEGRNPYGKINNPPTRGMFTWVKGYLNHIAVNRDTDNTGRNNRFAQQRTSYMRITPPAHGAGYAPEFFEPAQQPQKPNTYRFNPSVGRQLPGPYVLNSTTFGAGQTAGGVGGNQYAPTPGPPDQTSVAGSTGTSSGMPTWG